MSKEERIQELFGIVSQIQRDISDIRNAFSDLELAKIRESIFGGSPKLEIDYSSKVSSIKGEISMFREEIRSLREVFTRQNTDIWNEMAKRHSTKQRRVTNVR